MKVVELMLQGQKLTVVCEKRDKSFKRRNEGIHFEALFEFESVRSQWSICLVVL